MLRKRNHALINMLNFSAMIFLFLLTFVSNSACSSVKDDYSYEYRDDYRDFVDEYPDGRHTIRFEDDDDNYWRVRINDGDIVSVHKNGDLLSDDDLKEAESLIRRHIRKTHRELNHANRSFARGNSHFRFDSEELDEAMDELRDNLKNIGVKARVHINERELHEAMRELKRNLDNIHVSINDENIRMDFDNDFDFDFDFDDDINIDIDLGDFGEKMGKFGEAMGELGESVKDCNIDMDEFEDNMEDFSEKMNDLGFDMNELKYEMKRLKRFLIDVKEELVDDGYIDDMDDSVTLEFDDGDLYIDNERVDDDVRRKYERIHEKYYDEKPDDDWRIEL
jgi:sugar-specific transcriptional regulator TrmB